ncbi:hypothetical protein E2562_028833 [Oryza meyeriana var. granulata]|uniref:Uncharacterized protein n=1 Tax=Oryza meyeriana var. granulata TaxID=110450 RepID=A0A6G1FD09_9ORYZ|nr:hypothetical protein E2562_028833 [Oryza meyeriana var. granulata]
MSTPQGSRAPTLSSGAGAGSRDPTPSDAATGEPAQETQGTDVVEVDSGDDPVVVGNKRKLKSVVWQDFKKLKVSGFESPIVNALMTCLDDEEEASFCC